MGKIRYLIIPLSAVALFALTLLLRESPYPVEVPKAPEEATSPSQGTSAVLGDGRAEPAGSSTQPSTASYKFVLTTKFWVGERANASNDYISNVESYWDDTWADHFGGSDDPRCREDFFPCGFTPLENPFYVALPYGEREDDSDELKASAKDIPWYNPSSSLPLLKNRWIEVTYDGTTCYGQWEDVGPNEEDDYDYVFGDAPPRNTFGERAGLDISPALWDCLGMDDNAVTRWRFVDEQSVPDGPWTDTITTSPPLWGQGSQ